MSREAYAWEEQWSIGETPKRGARKGDASTTRSAYQSEGSALGECPLRALTSDMAGVTVVPI